jgi:hypothetical protein
MHAAIEAFEREYVERARAAAAGPIDGILLGREIDAPPSGGRFLAGWWCAPDADSRVVVLPNPWDDRSAITLYDQYTWQLTQSLLGHLARTLDDLHGVVRPLAYWDLLLVPWLQVTVTSAIDRLMFLDTARALAPDAPLLATRGVLGTPATLADASDQQLGDEWNAAFLRTVCERAGYELRDLPAVRSTEPPAPSRKRPSSRSRVAHLVATLDLVPRVMLRRLVERRLGSWHGRQVALLGATSFTPGQLRALAREVPGLRVAPRRGGGLRSGSAAETHPGRARLATELPGADRLGALLPILVPLTVLESHGDLVRVSHRLCGPASDVVHRMYATDDVENEFLARSAAAGRTLAFAQHGGASMQLSVAPSERNLHRDGRRYIVWGAAVESNVRPTADPYVQSLRDTHRGGSHVLLVEWMTPPYRYVYRFTTTPLANQVLAEEMRLVRFVQAAGVVHSHLLLKGFPGPEAAAARHPTLRELPLAEQWRRRPAPQWMRRARLAVVPYPDTPFIEAMAIGVPTIGLWDPSLWEMRTDAASHFDRLERLGVVHADPQRAAAKVREVYDEADAWWSSPEIADARLAFLNRFAIAGNWRAQWATAIGELLDEPARFDAAPPPVGGQARGTVWP